MQKNIGPLTALVAFVLAAGCSPPNPGGPDAAVDASHVDSATSDAKSDAHPIDAAVEAAPDTGSADSAVDVAVEAGPKTVDVVVGSSGTVRPRGAPVFLPKDLTIKAGRTGPWTWAQSRHSVTSRTGGPAHRHLRSTTGPKC